MSGFKASAALADEWGYYLTNLKNHEKDYSHGYPYLSPFEKFVEGFPEASTRLFHRQLILTRMVEGIIDRWNEIIIIGTEGLGLGVTNPLVCMSKLVYIGNEPCEELVKIVQRLWSESPAVVDQLDQGKKMVIIGLGQYLPVSDDFLVKLYKTDFDHYGFLALGILLERGNEERASELFRENASRYGDFDPLNMDQLVCRGLPPDDAKLWLDQSVNAGPGYEGHYENAIKRWYQ